MGLIASGMDVSTLCLLGVATSAVGESIPMEGNSSRLPREWELVRRGGMGRASMLLSFDSCRFIVSALSQTKCDKAIVLFKEPFMCNALLGEIAENRWTGVVGFTLWTALGPLDYSHLHIIRIYGVVY